jgi:hypothetical protein
LPLDYPNDRELLDHAFPLIGLTPPLEAKLLWIRSTLSVAEVECSVAYLEEAQGRDDIEILNEPRPLPFDAQGVLPYVKDISGHL